MWNQASPPCSRDQPCHLSPLPACTPSQPVSFLPSVLNYFALCNPTAGSSGGSRTLHLGNQALKLLLSSRNSAPPFPEDLMFRKTLSRVTESGPQPFLHALKVPLRFSSCHSQAGLNSSWNGFSFGNKFFHTIFKFYAF